MCNHIAIPSSTELKAQYPDLNIQDFDASYHSNAYDHEMVPILTNTEPGTIQMARWGYVPENAKSIEEMAGYDTQNARAETLYTSRLYGEAAKERRCIVFVKGFFEFKHYKGVKYPHYISKEDGQSFTFGGVWSEWNGMLTCSLITTPANALLEDIHNTKKRMPLILPRDQWEQWFDLSQSQSSIEQMMQPYPVADLIAWQVGGLITTKGADKKVPEVIKPISPSFTKLPFPDPVADPKRVQKEKKPKSKGKGAGDVGSQMGLF